MAKGKSPKNSKQDVKTTVIIVLAFTVAVLLFMLFSKEKHKAQPRGTAPKMEQPKIKPMVVLPAPVKLLPVKKVPPGSAGRIAFVLDDWGYNTDNCHYLKEITDPLAVAILPPYVFSPTDKLLHAQDVAKCAKANGKTIMLHLPLEPQSNKGLDSYPADYLINSSMSPKKVEKILEGYIAQIPGVEGVNNHTGSKATEDPQLMKIIFKRLKSKKLFFIDSITAKDSICKKVAREVGLPFARRNALFLDNDKDKESIRKMFKELVLTAHRDGYAIAIGHDNHLTLEVLKEQIPLLKQQGFAIVDIKELLNNQ